MERSKVYQRGQIWLWKDSIYGKKENGCSIPVGETNLRFDRFVLILQDEDTIGSGTEKIIIAPLSSKPDSEFSVSTYVTQMYGNSLSYIRVNSITTVHPAYLTEYICTLPDKTMELVDGCLLKLLMPKIIGALDENKIYNYFHADINNPVEYNCNDSRVRGIP